MKSRMSETPHDLYSMSLAMLKLSRSAGDTSWRSFNLVGVESIAILDTSVLTKLTIVFVTKTNPSYQNPFSQYL